MVGRAVLSYVRGCIMLLQVVDQSAQNSVGSSYHSHSASTEGGFTSLGKLWVLDLASWRIFGCEHAGGCLDKGPGGGPQILLALCLQVASSSVSTLLVPLAWARSRKKSLQLLDS